MDKTTRAKKNPKDKHNQMELEDAIASPAQASQPYWFLTNRNNLLDVLSSGMIKPASQYVKYYHDLGDFCKDSIPLLAKASPSSFVQEVASTPELFPVLLEIDLGNLQGGVHSITEQYEMKSGMLHTLDNALLVVVNGVIPISCLRSIHFRSPEEKDEYIARQYENVHLDTVPVHVSPAYFEESSPHIDVPSVLEKLAQIGDKQKLENPGIFKTADSMGGALMMLGYAITNNHQIPINAARDILATFLDAENISETLEITRSSTAATRWLPLLPPLLLNTKNAEEGQQEKEVLPSVISDLIKALHTPEDVLEVLLFESIVHTLTSKDSITYYNEEILSQISARFEKNAHFLQQEEFARNIEHYADILSRIDAVIRSTVDINDFSLKESPIAASLLFFLQRSEPSTAVSWFGELPIEHSEILANTMVFAGLLYGKSLIPIEYRPSKIFERFTDNFNALNINKLNRGLTRKNPISNIELSIKAGKNATVQSIKFGSTVLLQRELHVPLSTFPLKNKLQKEKPPVETQPEWAQKPAERAAFRPERNSHSIPPQLQYTQVLERLQASDLKSGSEKDAAIYLCQAVKWDDCIFHTISLEGKRYSLSSSFYDPQKPEFRIYGAHPPIFETLISTERFRRRLHETWGNLPERVRNGVVNRLAK